MVRTQRGAALGVEGAQELAQPALADHVEPDGRLVEEEDLRVVQQRRDDVAAHPLAEAELPDRGVEQVVEVEQVEEPPEVLAVPGRARCGRSSAAGRRSRAAAGPTTGWCAGRRRHRSCRASSIRSRCGLQPGDPEVARGRHQDAGEHLDRRRLPGAVRPDVADHLAGLDRERQVLDRAHDGPSCAAAGRSCVRRTKVRSRSCDVDQWGVGSGTASRSCRGVAADAGAARPGARRRPWPGRRRVSRTGASPGSPKGSSRPSR